MKTISLFLISLVVSANLYANESSKSKTNMKIIMTIWGIIYMMEK